MYAVSKLWKGKEKGATGYIEFNRKLETNLHVENAMVSGLCRVSTFEGPIVY
jgi:hypothetical protein